MGVHTKSGKLSLIEDGEYQVFLQVYRGSAADGSDRGLSQQFFSRRLR